VLSHLLAWWTSLYANHAALRTAVEFTHIGGVVAGGGSAIAADLATFRAAREGPAPRTAHLQFLTRTHGIVLAGLGALFVSGVLQFASDVDTFLYSRVFWLKMGLVVLLLINGALLLRAGRQATAGGARAWARVQHVAIASLVLWALTTLAGAALPNIG
jgi:hypothetical protein